MRNIFLDIFFTVSIGIFIYTILTLPHFIHMLTHLKYGIRYPFFVLILCGVISGILSGYIFHKFIK